jgi:hypothetical protein
MVSACINEKLLHVEKCSDPLRFLSEQVKLYLRLYSTHKIGCSYANVSVTVAGAAAAVTALQWGGSSPRDRYDTRLRDVA